MPHKAACGGIIIRSPEGMPLPGRACVYNTSGPAEQYGPQSKTKRKQGKEERMQTNGRDGLVGLHARG